MPDNKQQPPYPQQGKVWVETKEGGHWRNARGSVKPAKLNDKYLTGTAHMKISQPAAKHIVTRLRPYTEGVETGRLTSRVSGKLRLSLKETGKLSFKHLKDFDLHVLHPMGTLLRAPVKVVQQGDEIVVTIPIDKFAIKKHSALITGYFFDLVLLWGDATKESTLRTDSETSKLFAIGEERKNGCKLTMPLPKEPWMALLKVSCMEGDELAMNSKNYGMKVVSVG